jgi:hypothetical protein
MGRIRLGDRGKHRIEVADSAEITEPNASVRVSARDDVIAASTLAVDKAKQTRAAASVADVVVVMSKGQDSNKGEFAVGAKELRSSASSAGVVEVGRTILGPIKVPVGEVSWIRRVEGGVGDGLLEKGRLRIYI